MKILGYTIWDRNMPTWKKGALIGFCYTFLIMAILHALPDTFNITLGINIASVIVLPISIAAGLLLLLNYLGIITIATTITLGTNPVLFISFQLLSLFMGALLGALIGFLVKNHSSLFNRKWKQGILLGGILEFAVIFIMTTPGLHPMLDKFTYTFLLTLMYPLGILIGAIVGYLMELHFDWRRMPEYMKGAFIAGALMFSANSFFYMMPPPASAAAITVPISATETITTQPIQSFPLGHFTYSNLFIMLTVGAFVLSLLYLKEEQNRRKLLSFNGAAAVSSLLLMPYLLLASPISPFAIYTAYTTMDISVYDDAGNLIPNAQCYLYVNNVYQGINSGASGVVHFTNVPDAKLYYGACYCPTDSSKKSLEFRGTVLGPTYDDATISNCVLCTQGKQKCTSNVIYTCTSSHTWQSTKTCTVNQNCGCTSGLCDCSTASCGADGMKCLDDNTVGECKNGAWTNYRYTCLTGCSSGACNAACTSRWKCKDSTTVGLLKQDCTWMGLKNCAPGTCVETEDNAACDYPETPTTTAIPGQTTTTTYHVTTTAPVPTTTTIPVSCDKECKVKSYDWGVCSYQPQGTESIGEGFCQVNTGNCWCGTLSQTTITTVPTITTTQVTQPTTTTTIKPPEPQIDYFTYGAALFILMLVILIAYLYIKNKKKKGA